MRTGSSLRPALSASSDRKKPLSAAVFSIPFRCDCAVSAGARTNTANTPRTAPMATPKSFLEWRFRNSCCIRSLCESIPRSNCNVSLDFCKEPRPVSTPVLKGSRRVSRKASQFTESVIREMTREAMKYGAVNLSQGFPDFPAPDDVKRVAMQAIDDDINQYAITWGAKDFREAIARKTKWYLGLDIDPETEITVTCGSTEGMIAAMMATVDPGEEVVVFEPFYENYAPDAILSDARPRYVPLRAPDWTFDPSELRAAFSEKTKAIIICNPNNPTGKVFTRAEMELI